MQFLPRRPVKWVGSAKKDLDKMPEDVKDVFGHAIDMAQAGQKFSGAKPLQGFKSAGVLEIVEHDEGGTYRAVYTVKLANWQTGFMFCIASRRNRRRVSRRPKWKWT